MKGPESFGEVKVLRTENSLSVEAQILTVNISKSTVRVAVSLRRGAERPEWNWVRREQTEDEM